MNETLRQLHARKSVRVFEDKPIGAEEKQAILQAALQAPTAGNMALYTILDITDQGLKDRLAVSCDNQPFIAKAPLVLVFCADYHRWYSAFTMAGRADARTPAEGDFLLAANDALIAAQNAVVAAESLGIGSCYIGDIMENAETHRELLALPRFVAPITMLVFGYPTAQQRQREKPKRFALQAVVHENGYRPWDEATLRDVYGEQTGKTGEELDSFIQAFCKRKFDSDFTREMTRSVKVMLEEWVNGN